LPAMRLGDDLSISGSNLSTQGGAVVVFDNPKTGVVRELNPTPAPAAGVLAVHVPAVADDANAINEWGIGVYAVSLRVSAPNVPAWTTNSVPIALAPIIAIGPPPTPPDFHAGDTVSLTCTPRLRAEQEANVRVIFGSLAIKSATIDTPSTTPADLLKPSTLTFIVPTVPAGSYIVRLRVDGVDSLPITVSGSPPALAFDPTQKVNVA